jgi:hypothetical protein
VQGCEGGGPYWNWLPAKAGLSPNEDDIVELLGAERI